MGFKTWFKGLFSGPSTPAVESVKAVREDASEKRSDNGGAPAPEAAKSIVESAAPMEAPMTAKLQWPRSP